eukprot:CAMPEP_0172923916 /NCGR_PEP_ID=MMETSP1075-20121228/210659_1 /TAXON_ID=2916 /ORGANISM="Ceratium fusus, Strain PA161109" /LENGTH=37 /DNA_ID= /DNA_START= /DNA_END= /DNA_ORIENTATION=
MGGRGTATSHAPIEIASQQGIKMQPHPSPRPCAAFAY